MSLAMAVPGFLGAWLLVRQARHEPARSRLRALNRRVGWRMPEVLRTRLEVALQAAAVSASPEAALEMTAAAAVATAFVAFVMAPPLAPLAVVGIPVCSGVGLHLARHRRDRQTEAALPGALEQVAAELRSGGTVADAVAALAEADGPLGSDMARVRARAEFGAGLDRALAAWTEESDLHGVRATAGALAVATSIGGRAADAVEGLAASLRERLAVAAEARSLGTQARLSAIVVGAAPLGYLVLSLLVDPRALVALTGTTIGRFCLLAGLTLEALAALWMRRIVRVTP